MDRSSPFQADSRLVVSSPDAEILELVLEILPLEPDVMHMGPGGTVVTPGNERLEILSLPLCHHFDRTVGAIPDPSLYP